jgi:hypothetical protein
LFHDIPIVQPAALPPPPPPPADDAAGDDVELQALRSIARTAPAAANLRVNFIRSTPPQGFSDG